MVNAGVNPIFVLGKFVPQKQREDHPAGLEEDAVIEDLHGLRSHTSNRAAVPQVFTFSPSALELGHNLSPIFFGLTTQVIPLCSGLRVFCFVSSALESTGFLPTGPSLAQV
jgi:hypothetical protein